MCRVGFFLEEEIPFCFVVKQGSKYSWTAEVVRIRVGRQELRVKKDSIDGWMAASRYSIVRTSSLTLLIIDPVLYKETESAFSIGFGPVSLSLSFNR